MKGVKKCYGLLLVLFIMLGLSLNVSSDANAYRYDISTIPFGHPASDYIPGEFGNHFGDAGALYNPFSFKIPDDLDYTFTPKVPSYFYTSSKGDWAGDSGCNFKDGYNMLHSNEGSAYNTYSYFFTYYDDNYFTYNNSHVVGGTSSQISPYVECNQLYQPLNNLSYNVGSFPPYVFGNPNYRSFPPLRYNYNGFYLKDSQTTDGFDRSTRLDFAELFLDPDSDVGYGNMPETFKSITIPFGIYEHFDDLFDGQKFDFKLTIDFDNDDSSVPLVLDDSLTATLNYRYNNLHGDPTNPRGVGSSQCSTNIIQQSNPDVVPYSLNIECSITTDFSNLSDGYDPIAGFWLTLDSDNHLWSYRGISYMTFARFYAITNDDPTFRGDFSNYRIAGVDKNIAPGSVVGDSSSDSVDWFSSFTNLFNFDFINPFTPIFGMFSNSDSCVNIPILAGLLHSEESTVCPFFDSNVRSIMTPVFSLSSMMLIFGFAVKWLGSRSGNFIEDSGGLDSGGFHIENKFRRKS